MALSPWEFACLLYDQDGVKPALLAMQDEHRLDIPLLLFALWAGMYRRRLSATEIKALADVASTISTNLVQPLRDSRRWLKAQFPEATAAHQDLLNAELAAEKLLLETLQTRLLPEAVDQICGSAQAIANGELYLSLMNIPRDGENAARMATVFSSLEPAQI